MKTKLIVAIILALSWSFTLAAESNETAKRGRFPEKMTVKVVDEAGQPITNATGYHRFGKYVNFKVDENGVFEILMPSEEEHKKRSTTDFTIHAEGYGPYSAHFKSDLVIPETFTVVLKPAQKIGGIVVDENSKPLEGVKVELTLHFETAYKTADIFVTSIDTTTDAEGKWSLFHLPATFSGSPSLSLQKEGYLTTHPSVPVAKLTPDAEGNYHERLTIEKGYTFSGKVVDENGSPFKDAALQMGERYDDGVSQRTDENGCFAFKNLPLKDENLLTVWAPGKAAQAMNVEVRSENEPLIITMKPGRKITFEAFDSTGKPISGAIMKILHINGLPGDRYGMRSDMFNGKAQFGGESKTDENGQLVWNEGPHCPFDFSCGKREHIGVSTRVEVDQDTVRVVLYRSKVMLKVVDDATGEPIPAFTVVSRMYANADDEHFNSWSQPEPGANGSKEENMYGWDNKAIRFDVEAPGYEKQNSRKIKHGEEDVELEIRLVKSTTLPENLKTETVTETENGIQKSDKNLPLSGGKVLTPDGQVAVNAAITFDSDESVHTNEKGEFLLSDAQKQAAEKGNFALKITHTSGVAVVDGKEFRQKYDSHSLKDAQPISLQKWGRIEGTLLAGTKTLEGTRITIRWMQPDSLSANPGFYESGRTKKGGRFVFEQVPPGKVQMSRHVSAGGGGYWSTHCGFIEVLSGETTHCTVGGTGRAVLGKAVFDKSVTEKIDFTKFTARIVPKPENLDDLVSPKLPKECWIDRDNGEEYEAYRSRLNKWYQTPEGKVYKEKNDRHLKALAILRFNPLRSDGTFRFDDLSAGEYALVISETNNCGIDFAEDSPHYRGFFAVELPPDVKSGEPLNLGEFTLASEK